MAPNLSSTSSDTWSDSAYDDVPTEFFTFSTPLSYKGSGILGGSESTGSLPSLNCQERRSCGIGGPNSPEWVPLTIGPLGAPQPFDISIPEPPYDSSIDGNSDKSFTDCLNDSFVRRRLAEYIHRPPVWRIQPFKVDNGLSSPGSDSGSNITSELGIADHLDTCRFCSTAQRKNFPTKRSVPDFSGWFDYCVPSRFSGGGPGYEERLNAMASTWAEEPFVVGMATIPDLDVECVEEDGVSTSQSKDKGKARDDSQYESSSSALQSSLPPFESHDKGIDESQPSSSSSPLRRSHPSRDKGLSSGIHLPPSPSSDPFYKTSRLKGKAKDGSQYQPSYTSPQSSSQNAPERNLPLHLETNSDHDERLEVSKLLESDCETRTGDYTKPANKTSMPGSNILEDSQADFDANVSDEFASIRSDRSRVEPARRASGKLNRPAEVKDQRTKIDPQSSATASPSPSRVVRSNVPQEWILLKQDGVCSEKILDTYKDIRVASCPGGKNYGIESGSRVICIEDTNVVSTADDEYSLEVGDAYIVLQMYGDLWASCLKLSLTDPVTTVPVGGSMTLTFRKEYAVPGKPESIKFLPLCSVTLEGNFGEYIRRRQKLTPVSNTTLSPDPCNGQQVDPPKRKQSQQAANNIHDGGSVLIPLTMVKEFAVIHSMPDGILANPRDDRNISYYGHVDESTARRAMSSKETRTDGSEKSRFFGRQQIGDRLTAKNGRILGLGKTRRTQSSADSEAAMGKSTSMGQGTSPGKPGAKSAAKDDAIANPTGDIADTGRERGSNLFPENLESSSPHNTTSQVASNSPNPPKALAGHSTLAEVRDLYPGNAISTDNGGTGVSATPGSATYGEANLNDDAPGDGGQGSPSGAAASNSDPSGFPETVITSVEEHKEAFAVADEVAPDRGSQPYVTEGEVPAFEVPEPDAPIHTEFANQLESPKQKSTLPFNKRTIFKHFRRMGPFNRRTQSDFGP